MPTPVGKVTITHPTLGDFVFRTRDNPIFGQRCNTIRSSEQSEGLLRYEVGVQGCFYEDGHQELVARLQELFRFLEGGFIKLKVESDTTTIFNHDITILEHNDPIAWHEYVGDYSFSGFYYTDSTIKSPGSPAHCHYAALTGNFAFAVTPSIHIHDQFKRRGRQSFMKSDLGCTVTLTLTGSLYQDVVNARGYSSAMQLQIESMRKAFSSDGVLVYGPLIQYVRVVSVDIPSHYPSRRADYSIVLEYERNTIFEYSFKRSYTRIHSYPLIRERPFCPSPRVDLGRSESTQVVSYDFFAKGASFADVNSFISTEALLLVHSGGIELPGGKEERDEDEIALTVSFQKYHKTHVRANLRNT